MHPSEEAGYWATVVIISSTVGVITFLVIYFWG